VALTILKLLRSSWSRCSAAASSLCLAAPGVPTVSGVCPLRSRRVNEAASAHHVRCSCIPRCLRFRAEASPCLCGFTELKAVAGSRWGSLRSSAEVGLDVRERSLNVLRMENRRGGSADRGEPRVAGRASLGAGKQAGAICRGRTMATCSSAGNALCIHAAAKLRRARAASALRLLLRAR